jgi:hypothetical protein
MKKRSVVKYKIAQNIRGGWDGYCRTFKVKEFSTQDEAQEWLDRMTNVEKKSKNHD